jgi:hypothetical protein
MRHVSYKYYVTNPLSEEAMAQQVGQYDEGIAHMDHRLRAFYASWVAQRPNTIFMLVSDHGEEFGERGSWGHSHTLTPEQLHVPWIVVGPGVRTQVVEERVGLEDLASTIGTLAGIEFPGDGIDRALQLRNGKSPTPAGHVPARYAETSRSTTIKLRWHEPPHDLIFDLEENQYSVFDLEQDPRATAELLAAGEAEELVQPLSDALFTWLGQPWEVKAPGMLKTDGVFMTYGTHQGRKLEAVEGLRFAAYPLDATVSWTPPGGKPGKSFQPLVGRVPREAHRGLRYLGREHAAKASELTPEQEEQLRSLGYIR